MIEPIQPIPPVKSNIKPILTIDSDNYDVRVYNLYDVFDRTEDDLTPFMVDTFEKQK